RGRGGPGPAALQRDLAEVQFVRGEVRVRRVVPVEAAHRGVAEEYRPAAVRLQPVLVRVDHDRVAVRDGAPGGGVDAGAGAGAGVRAGPGQQREEAAVRGVDVQPYAVPVAQRQRIVDRVDRAESGGTGGQHDGADPSRVEQPAQRGQVDPAGRVGGHRVAGYAQQVAHARMRVVGVRAVRHAAA